MQTPPPPTCIQLHTLSFTLLGHFWHILFSLFKTFYGHILHFLGTIQYHWSTCFLKICVAMGGGILSETCCTYSPCCRSACAKHSVVGHLESCFVSFSCSRLRRLTSVFRTSGPSCWCRTCVLQTWYWAEVVLTFCRQTWAGFPNFTRLKIATAHWIQVTLISSADNTPPRYKINPDWPLVVFPTQL